MTIRHQPWEAVEREVVFAAGPIREIAREAVRLPDGRVIPDFYSVALPDYVLVYALTGDDEVLLFRQYKHGPRRVCLSFPGGHVDGNETAEDAARRELLEETGYRAGRLTALGTYVVDANQRCATAYLFRADSCRRERDPRSGDLEEMELIRVRRAELLRAEHLSEMAVISHVSLAFLGDRPPAAADPPNPRSR